VDFREALAQRESGKDYTVRNDLGYLGRYQFGMARLTDLGYAERKPGAKGWGNSSFQWVEPWSDERWLGNAGIQELAFREHMERHARSVGRRYGQYVGQPLSAYRDGAAGEVTLSGMLGVAHLLGLGGLGKLLAGDDGADAYGTKASDYLLLLSGHF